MKPMILAVPRLLLPYEIAMLIEIVESDNRLSRDMKDFIIHQVSR